ncbi:MAG TPA: glycoside hydrolase family 127 protein [bacterium]|nr:glycoside hydrolase family 127 protein [bacterium]HPN33557.1 glycoside hydrolase family 127 protein [bacterium]
MVQSPSLLCCAGMILFASLSPAAEAPLLKLSAVPFTQVHIEDSFWAPRQEINRTASIPINLEMLDKSGNLINFDLAAEGKRKGYNGPVYMDSDLYKALEAASYSLAAHPDAALQKKIDAIIRRIAAAQQKDGYLNTYYTVNKPDQRWTNLRDHHELYCAGHLFEAAVAHYQATGKRTLLRVATRFADHICSLFGPGPGQRMGYPGHPEIELALIKLWRVTGQQRYFDLARFFIENRGIHFFAREHQTPEAEYDGSYWQDDMPLCEHRTIKGHAVRACYLLSGATDVAAVTDDAALLKMIQRVWRNTIERNQYITGGIGPSSHNEGFTVDYDLPNLTAYQETCATIALAQWNHRLALLYGDSRYADVVERCLYNGMLSGVSQDGKTFFYVNRLESDGGQHRSPWFGCACCPPNVARTVASLGGYVCAQDDHSLWMNLYLQGRIQVIFPKGRLWVQVLGNYPWDGRVRIKPSPEKPLAFALRLRKPGWCDQATVHVNGKAVAPPMDKGYYVLDRTWQSGDEVELNLDMPVRRMIAHPQVQADAGRTAFQRGPLVYCLEACDHAAKLASIFLPPTCPLTAEWDPSLFNGMMILKGKGLSTDSLSWKGKLYQAMPSPRQVEVKAVPYFVWDNRAPGAMMVWLPQAMPPAAVGGMERNAVVTASYIGSGSRLQGIKDGIEPKRSSDHTGQLCHFWPHKGGEEWVRYQWPQPVRIAGCQLYWFDDTGRGECRPPVDWRIEYFQGDTWKAVAADNRYSVLLDGWNTVTFSPIATTELRLLVKLQDQWSAGIHEWRIIEPEE